MSMVDLFEHHDEGAPKPKQQYKTPTRAVKSAFGENLLDDSCHSSNNDDDDLLHDESDNNNTETRITPPPPPRPALTLRPSSNSDLNLCDE
jgi:hypothetical protein